jgi:hypothetical protein
MDYISNTEFGKFVEDQIADIPTILLKDGNFVPLPIAIDLWIKEYNKIPYEYECVFCYKRTMLKPVFDSKEEK